MKKAYLIGVFCIITLIAGPFDDGTAQDKLSFHEQQQQTRLQALGYSTQPKLYIRLFKLEKTLEIWLKTKAGYKLYQSYQICNYSGSLGPKLKEGDRQAPEGFYHVPAEDVIWRSKKWPRALNLAFPNIHDVVFHRSGSYLLIHGGCSSIGCYALETGLMEALFALVSLAVRGGQNLFPIHIFPFRLTEQNLAKYKTHQWAGFWRAMRPAFDHFNRERALPLILVCKEGYKISRSRAFSSEASYQRGNCIQPLPVQSKQLTKLTHIQWVKTLKQRYPVSHPLLTQDPNSLLKIRLRCNLKRPSCRKWLVLRQKMLKKGTLPKSLLK